MVPHHSQTNCHPLQWFQENAPHAVKMAAIVAHIFLNVVPSELNRSVFKAGPNLFSRSKQNVAGSSAVTASLRKVISPPNL